MINPGVKKEKGYFAYDYGTRKDVWVKTRDNKDFVGRVCPGDCVFPDFKQKKTAKWLAWQHQVALNLLVSSFILKEKLYCFDDLPLLSARDIKQWFVFKLYKEMTEEQFFDRMYELHLIRQRGINNSYIVI